jgi:hypothetical protein
LFSKISKSRLCGGGVHNLFLFERLICQNPDSKVTLTNDLGVSADYVEAAAFAYFVISCVVFSLLSSLCVLCPMLPVSLDSPFLTALFDGFFLTLSYV